MGMKVGQAMMQQAQRERLTGIVEMDETYIGGKPRKGNGGEGTPDKRGCGNKKTPVVGMVERQGRKNKLKAKSLNALVGETV